MSKRMTNVWKTVLLNCVLISLIFFSGCEPDVSDDEIPYVQFPDIIINLSLPTYTDLKFDGGHVYIGGGVRGIIIYRQNISTYIAYERNSSFRPFEACATVDVHNSGLYMHDTCSNSTFDFNTGNPTSGPAIRPLRRYVVRLNSFELTVTDDIAN